MNRRPFNRSNTAIPNKGSLGFTVEGPQIFGLSVRTHAQSKNLGVHHANSQKTPMNRKNKVFFIWYNFFHPELF
jgi:hypothetical protein